MSDNFDVGPCYCCGWPIANHHSGVYGFVCGCCSAMERSTELSGYWVELEPDPEIAHVDGDDKEVEQ